MKRILSICALSGILLSACSARPVHMYSDFQGKMITRCDNDIFCFRKPYEVAWDRSCQSASNPNASDCAGWNNHDLNSFPVSYRSREFVYANDPHGYAVMLPAGGNISVPKENVKEETIELP